MTRTAIFTNRLKRFSTILLLLTAAITAQAAPGDLDTTFGATGKIRVGVGGGDDEVFAVARQADGKLVVAGSSYEVVSYEFSLVRYNANGTLDTTFGNNGRVITDVDTDNTAVEKFKAVTVLADGKILAAGYSSGVGVGLGFVVCKYNADGTLDASFSGNGVATTFIGADLTAMQIQTDGKIVVAGYDGQDKALVARYNANGSPDTTFSGDGVVEADIINSSFSRATINTMGIQIDGKIVVAGSVGITSSESVLALARFNSNGSFDNSFGSGGIVTRNDPGSGATARSIAFVQPDTETDRIVVAGETREFTVNGDIALWSFNRGNGSVDATFGTGGKVITDIPGSFNDGGAYSIKTQTGNFGNPTSFVVAGRIGSDFAVLRYQMSGTLDTTFGGGSGYILTDVDGNLSNDFCRAMLIQPDNRIVAAGSSGGEFGIVRYNPTGTLDTTFNTDGKRTDDVGNTTAVATATVVQTDGKIIIAGDFAVARFLPTGTLDTTFDGDGKVKLGGFITDAAIQADGKIVVAALIRLTNFPLFGNQFIVYRLNSDGSRDTSFSTDGEASTTFGSSGDSIAVANAISVQSDGAIVVAGYANIASGGNDFAVARFLSNGTLDASFGTGGKITTPVGTGSDQGNAMKIQTDGKIVVAGTSENLFAVVRYNPDGSLDTSFSFDGKLLTPIGTGNAAANDLAIQSGKIIVAGSASTGGNSDFAVVRYTASGSLDTSFDADGVIITPVSTGNDLGNALAIQSDGKILVAGTSNVGANSDFAVVRYNTDGALDSTMFAAKFDTLPDPNTPLYGSGGKVVVDVSGGSDSANSIALDSAGRAIIAGQANGLFGVVRLSGDFVPTAAEVSVSGRVRMENGKGIRHVRVSLTDSSGATRTVLSGVSGAYRFEEVPVGETYILTAAGKRFVFVNPTQILSVNEQIENFDFIGYGQLF